MNLGQYADIDPRAGRHSCAKRLNHERLHSQDVLSMLRLRKLECKAKDALQSLRYSVGCVDPALENNEGPDRAVRKRFQTKGSSGFSGDFGFATSRLSSGEMCQSISSNGTAPSSGSAP